MKPLGLLSQLAAAGLAIAIVVFYVSPTLNEVGTLQTQVQQYKQERERVSETNANLASLVSELDAINVSDRTRLATYMPTFLDEVAVLRDLEIIMVNTGVSYTSIEYSGETVSESDDLVISDGSNTTTSHDFKMTVEGTYTRLKDFFSLLEQNHYPLQIKELKLDALEGGFLRADVTVVTYVNSSNEVIFQ